MKYEAFVINLDRSPERLAWFRAQNEQVGLPMKRKSAVDGRKLNRASPEVQEYISPTIRHFSAGSIGCAISHLQLWRHAVREKRSIIVFEDDAVIRRDFRKSFVTAMAAADDDWDIVLLGYNTDNVLDVKFTPGCDLQSRFTSKFPTLEELQEFSKVTVPAAPLRLNNAWGLCGYALSETGAKKLLRVCVPMRDHGIQVPMWGPRPRQVFSIDGFLNVYYRRLKAYALVPALVLPLNEKATSTIGYGEKAAPW